MALDEDETAHLINLLGESRLYMPTILAVTTGLRRGEILGLRWDNVDLVSGMLTVVQSLEQTKVFGGGGSHQRTRLCGNFPS